MKKLSLLFILAIIYFNTLWPGIKDDDRCYSPNKNYYLVQAYSIRSYLMPRTYGLYGNALVYDAITNKLVAKFKVSDFDRGPIWSDNPSRIFFMDDEPNSSRITTLPNSPGRSIVQGQACS